MRSPLSRACEKAKHRTPPSPASRRRAQAQPAPLAPRPPAPPNLALVGCSAILRSADWLESCASWTNPANIESGGGVTRSPGDIEFAPQDGDGGDGVDGGDSDGGDGGGDDGGDGDGGVDAGGDGGGGGAGPLQSWSSRGGRGPPAPSDLRGLSEAQRAQGLGFDSSRQFTPSSRPVHAPGHAPVHAHEKSGDVDIYIY